MTSSHTIATAGDSPAVRASGEGPRYEVVLWPHRSLTPQIFRNVFLTLLGGFAMMLAVIWFSPFASGHRSLYFTALLILLGFCGGAALLTRWMIVRHAREAQTIRERVAIEGNSLIIERMDRHGRRAWSFSAHWAQVRTRDTKTVQTELLVTQSGRAISVGLFLSPEERANLAEELRRALNDFNAGRL